MPQSQSHSHFLILITLCLAYLLSHSLVWIDTIYCNFNCSGADSENFFHSSATTDDRDTSRACASSYMTYEWVTETAGKEKLCVCGRKLFANNITNDIAFFLSHPTETRKIFTHLFLVDIFEPQTLPQTHRLIVSRGPCLRNSLNFN